jgi:hypothetical protein
MVGLWHKRSDHHYPSWPASYRIHYRRRSPTRSESWQDGALDCLAAATVQGVRSDPLEVVVCSGKPRLEKAGGSGVVAGQKIADSAPSHERYIYKLAARLESNAAATSTGAARALGPRGKRWDGKRLGCRWWNHASRARTADAEEVSLGNAVSGRGLFSAALATPRFRRAADHRAAMLALDGVGFDRFLAVQGVRSGFRF